ncbi:MAG TPA: hypothetical protein VNO33_15440 [Kofleriaceae bacterium]|nr:hypothetical protein [Kofleriaceae bacterium]
MRKRLLQVAWVVLVGSAAWSWARADKPPSCPPPARAVLYPAVEPIFAEHCASCHDARKADNRAAQRVFEMSRYPFSTERPATLLADLREMFIGRGSLSRDEKCAGIAWIDGGGRDARGKPPRWRAPPAPGASSR